MKLTYEAGSVTWIDIISPSHDEIRDLVNDFGIDPLVAEELMIQIERPKVRNFPSYHYLVLHFPRLSDTDQSDELEREYEMDFLIFGNTLITIHEKSFPLMYEFSKSIQVPQFTESLPTEMNGGILFLYMMRHFYSHIATELDAITKNLRGIESKVFSGREQEMVQVLSNTNRKVLDLKRAIRFHGNTMKQYARTARAQFGDHYITHVSHVFREYRELAQSLEGNRETIEGLWKTNDTLLSTKTNDTMKKLTALSFVTFPLSVIVGMFGMNMSLPLVGDFRDFMIVILGMCAVAALLTAYLQYKKWL